MFYFLVCMCTMCVPGIFRGQKRVSDLELELWMVVTHHVGAEN